MAGQAAGGHTAAGLNNNGLASLLLIGRANINEPPPPKKHTETTDGRPRGSKGREGNLFCVYQSLTVRFELKMLLSSFRHEQKGVECWCWSSVFSAALWFALVLLMDLKRSCGAGWRRQGGWGPVSATPGWWGRQEEMQSSRGSGSTCAGQWQPVKLN